MILRQGAISARLGERWIIPLNMRDGAIIGKGVGNPDWNHSAPHGAGRVCSRTDAKFAYTVEDYQAAMAGIYTTTATEGSLDECPMVYKAPQRILDAIGDAVEVEQIVRPVYNFKAC
jgi:RNA-splicing ligase RtcB